MSESALMWFRRDLRIDDNAALHHALKGYGRVYCAFVFDTEILDALTERADRRVEFIWHSLQELDARLREYGGALIVRHGRAREEIVRLAAELGVAAVFANRDYEPPAIDRDEEVRRRLAARGVLVLDFKDQVIFDGAEVQTRGGEPFRVFTPYKNAWLARLEPYYLRAYPVRRYARHLARSEATSGMPSLGEMGFQPARLSQISIACGMSGARRAFDDFLTRIDRYHERRDYPALKGPSYLSVHLRFGTISIRELAVQAHGRAAMAASKGAEVWLGELIWRDFYQMILSRFPHVVDHAFRREYDGIRFDDRPEWFAAWCQGRTGYPLVDAAMRQLNRTGYMHNRLRMLCASFLVKDLGIDWRLGEKYFAAQLIDYDLAANNGGWQWAASTGCDAQPYFRVFNPVTQSQKFDPEGKFIRRYVPELAGCVAKQIHAPWQMSGAAQEAAGVRVGRDYPAPLVDHAVARERTLARYGRLKPIS